MTKLCGLSEELEVFEFFVKSAGKKQEKSEGSHFKMCTISNWAVQKFQKNSSMFLKSHIWLCIIFISKTEKMNEQCKI